MITSDTVNVVEDGVETANDDSRIDENEILSSARIKQRRATVAPTAVPAAHLPRYLRDPGRYGSNRSRRQSMPVQYITHQPLPKLELTNSFSEAKEEVDGSSDNCKEPTKDNQCPSPKSPVKNSSSFPLDYRLQKRLQNPNQYNVGSSQEINNSSEVASLTSIRAQNGIDNKGHDENELILMISSRTPSPKFLANQRTLSPNLIHSDKIRRHSIAVSVLSDTNQIRSGSPLPGMADLGNFERSFYKSRDRIISVPSKEDAESVRTSEQRRMSRYVPKPNNHFSLSLFSCLCCCPLIGLVAVIYSLQVDRKYENGEKEASVLKSKNARCWAVSAVAIGMMVILGASMFGVAVLANAL